MWGCCGEGCADLSCLPLQLSRKTAGHQHHEAEHKMTGFFEKNIGRISGSVQRTNQLCRDLESQLDLSQPDYLNIERIKLTAHQRGTILTTQKAAKLLCRIKRKNAGWSMT